MPWFDLPLEELREYKPVLDEPADFDAFWKQTLDEFAPGVPDVSFVPVDDDLYQQVEVQKIIFAGYANDPIHGWLLLPNGAGQALPCIVSYVGYGGGMGQAIEHTAPVAAGFAHMVMDTRGQGGTWGGGQTQDPHGSPSHHPGFMTKGIESRESYYYRRVYVDAVCAVRAIAQHPKIDVHRIAVNGGSQGGGLSIAAAALSGDTVRACCADVPFLCHFAKAITMTDRLPYAEIANYLKVYRGASEPVRRTLSYFDGVSLAARIQAPALFSAGLMDMVCPPSTVFAAYNRVPGEKDIAVYDFNEHEGGGAEQMLRRLRFFRRHLIEGEHT
jgi:cephalosporin-C deacetylase